MSSGAEIFEQRLRELSEEEAQRSSAGHGAGSGATGGGMDYIDSWAEQNNQGDGDEGGTS